ncbi:MAG: NfeD family protein [Desulfobulbaceae bacterium]|nr:NfeD family protein [Desulfobulbaceae bacterium]
MKIYLIPTLLQLVGVLVVIAEIILPSAGLLSLLAISIFGYSLFLVFTDISIVAGIAFVIADLIMLPSLLIVGIKMLANSPVTLRTELSSKHGVTSQAPELSRYLGMHGEAITDLRPSGMAKIDGKRIDVVTGGEYIERESKLIVLAVSANQIVVAKKHDGAS